MARARDMSSALRVAFVWLLVLVAVPVGSGPFERMANADACGSWCPCEETEGHADVEELDEDCDEDCEQDCNGCCDARAPVAVGLEQLPSALPHAVFTRGLPGRDAPGCCVATDVFRPPRSLS